MSLKNQMTIGKVQIIKGGGFMGSYSRLGFVYTVYRMKPFKFLLRTTNSKEAIAKAEANR